MTYGTATVRTFGLFGGDLGAWQTLHRMRSLINAALVDPLVVGAAKDVAMTCPPADEECIARALREWLAGRFQFVRDPLGVELLHTPRLMVQTIATRGVFAGDCDDAAILGAALGKAVGLRARLRAIGFRRGGPLVHVIADVRTPRGWADLDVTRPAQFAGRLPSIARVVTVGV